MRRRCLYAPAQLLSSVPWGKLTHTEAAGAHLSHQAFLTQAPLTAKTGAPIIPAGRTRWKGETENNPTLTPPGYHLDHTCGHGPPPLAALFAPFNLLAFLFPTLLDLLAAPSHHLRRSLGSRTTFCEDLRALTRALGFARWPQLLAFIHQGLHGHPPLTSS
jgi:hypothetical protein